MKFLEVILILCALRLCYAPNPRPTGYLLTPWPTKSPEVIVEAFIDHLCSDCKEEWPVLYGVAKAIESVGVTIVHIFPLPYHHNAYFAQIIGQVVRREQPEKFVDYIELIFKHQESFLKGAVNMTEPQVKSAMATLVSTSLGIDVNTILSGFTDEKIKETASYDRQYAASRGISGTPSLLWNGLPGTYDTWTNLVHMQQNLTHG